MQRIGEDGIHGGEVIKQRAPGDAGGFGDLGGSHGGAVALAQQLQRRIDDRLMRRLLIEFAACAGTLRSHIITLRANLHAVQNENCVLRHGFGCVLKPSGQHAPRWVNADRLDTPVTKPGDELAGDRGCFRLAGSCRHGVVGEGIAITRGVVELHVQDALALGDDSWH